MNIENFLKERGIARNKKQANIIMIAIIVICFITIVFVSKKDKRNYNDFDTSQLSPAEIELMELSDEDNNINTELDVLIENKNR